MLAPRHGQSLQSLSAFRAPVLLFPTSSSPALPEVCRHEAHPDEDTVAYIRSPAHPLLQRVQYYIDSDKDIIITPDLSFWDEVKQFYLPTRPPTPPATPAVPFFSRNLGTRPLIKFCEAIGSDCDFPVAVGYYVQSVRLANNRAYIVRRDGSDVDPQDSKCGNVDYTVRFLEF